MNINIYMVLLILFTHWVADFLFQTDKMAQGKSKNWRDLIDHTSCYSLIFMLVFMVISILTKDFWLPFKFAGITFIFHTLTDYFTSRLNSKLWAEKKVHWFFVSIGFDQFLHFAQLLITYQLLTK